MLFFSWSLHYGKVFNVTVEGLIIPCDSRFPRRHENVSAHICSNVLQIEFQ